MKPGASVLRAGAVVLLLSAIFGCSREDRSAAEAERVTRRFFIALAEGDEASARECVLSSQKAEVLCPPKGKPEELEDARAKMGRMTCREAKPGESIALPDGRKLPLKADVVHADKKLMVCSAPGEKLGGPVWLVREGGHWKVDAEPVIALVRMAMRQRAQTSVTMLATALVRYQLDTGRYPDGEHWQKALIEPPSDESAKERWRGPYLEGGMPNDPWGTPYRYACPGIRNPDGFDLFSCGRDKREGGGDDIGNWQE